LPWQTRPIITECVLAANEVLGPVDRIDQPVARRAERPGRRRQLLGDHRIGGEALGEPGEDQLRRPAIGDRDRLVARLHLDPELAALHPCDLGTREPRQLDRSRQLALEAQLLPPPGHSKCLTSSTLATLRPDSRTSSAAAPTSSPLDFAISPLGR
jgi:hypothetical protein